jgi:hypothetical protein
MPTKIYILSRAHYFVQIKYVPHTNNSAAPQDQQCPLGGAPHSLEIPASGRGVTLLVFVVCCREWRISHALSHHLYTNSLLDLELALFEPMMQWVPCRTKSVVVRYVSWLYSFIIYAILFHGNIGIR